MAWQRYVLITVILLFTQTLSAAEKVGDAALDAAITRSTLYIANHIKRDGTFVYQLHINPARPQKERYNLLRHAGTIYALASARDATVEPNLRSSLDARLLLTGAFLRDHAIAPVQGVENAAAIWTQPRLVPSAKRSTAKLGGAGLALVAFSRLHEMDAEAFSLEQLQQLAQFIRFMQLADGSFHSKYSHQGGYDPNFTSLYYPGEAMLGLVMLYQLDADPAWLSVVGKGMANLAHVRKDDENVPADHWVLLATAAWMPHFDKTPEGLVTREAVLRHTRQICERMLRDQITDPAHPGYGSFRITGDTCPTATRLEGLLASLKVLPEETDADLRARIRTACDLGVAYLVRAQIKDGPLIGGVPRSTFQITTGNPQRDLRINDRVGEIRIDYVQHALSAMLAYRALRSDVDSGMKKKIK